MKFKTNLAVAALLAIGFSSAAAYADTMTFTLTDPNQSVSVNALPATVTYEATVSAPLTNSGDVFLNGDSFNVAAPITLDDSDFLGGFPLSLAPGDSFTGDLFVLTVPVGTHLGTYLGTFTIQGGADSSASGTLGTVDFSLQVTPEPESVVLLLTVIAGFLWSVYQGKRRGWAR